MYRPVLHFPITEIASSIMQCSSCATSIAVATIITVLSIGITLLVEFAIWKFYWNHKVLIASKNVDRQSYISSQSAEFEEESVDEQSYISSQSEHSAVSESLG